MDETPAGSLSISNGAILSGSGTVPPFVCAGTVRPGGTVVGALTVSSGTAVFNAGAIFQVNLTALCRVRITINYACPRRPS